MTLILARRFRGAHFLMGDLLLSTQTELSQAISMPGRFDDRLPEVDRHLVGLCHKLLRINDRLAVAWAGNYLVARHVIRAVASQFARTEPPSGDAIKELMRGMGLLNSELASVSFLFWSIVGPDGGVPQFSGLDHGMSTRWTNPKDQDDFCLIAGTGAYHFLHLVALTHQGVIGGTDPFTGVLSATIMRAGQALHEESTSNAAYDFRYGGGFETLVAVERGFEKIPTSHVFWRETETGLELVGPIFFMHYHPSLDRLCIRRFVRVGDRWEQSVFPVHNLLADDGGSSFEVDPTVPISSPVSTIHHFMSTNLTKTIHKFGPTPNIRVTFDREIEWQVEPALFRELDPWPPSNTEEPIPLPSIL